MDNISRSAEKVIVFECGGERLLGILHQGSQHATTGVLIIVGGPQYRVGSHRQFVFTARALAQQGVPVMRFDYRGMGDSTGADRDFDSVNEDICAAVNQFYTEHQTMSKVILWGLCDAASACLLYAHTDKRVGGLILLNPWVHSTNIEARARLKTYYVSRLLNKDLWRKVALLKFDYIQALKDISRHIREILNPQLCSNGEYNHKEQEGNDFVSRMLFGLSRFEGKIAILLSENDITSAEFKELVKSDKRWAEQIRSKDVTIVDIKKADHTFSSKEWKILVSEITLINVKEVAANLTVESNT